MDYTMPADKADDYAISGYVDFEKERAAGRLKNEFAPTNLTMSIGDSMTVVGTIDKDNRVHWNGKMTLEMCQQYIQSQLDQTRWMANLPR